MVVGCFKIFLQYEFETETWATKTGVNFIIFSFTIREQLTIIRCDKELFISQTDLFIFSYLSIDIYLPAIIGG